jgi:hypothetical protein
MIITEFVQDNVYIVSVWKWKIHFWR